ncbi:MAG: hypothetical protein L3J07_01165 [Candidatus Magasanikbacteria bacterium]|nr:hypothetical protein [Candidatus Magasanikbacteria bacterium]
MKIVRLLLSSLFLVLFIILYNWFFIGFISYEFSEIAYNIILWVLLIPFLFVNGKWYFKQDEPNTKKGILLGVVWIASLILLELILGNVVSGLISYIIFFEILLLAILFGFEFDSTYSAP